MKLLGVKIAVKTTLNPSKSIGGARDPE